MVRIRTVRCFKYVGTLAVAILLALVFLTQDYHTFVADRGSSSASPASIYFAETSIKTHLDARKACSIESAALHHPHSDVTLYSIIELSSDDIYMTVLRNISNIRFDHLNPNALFDGSPLATWAFEDRIRDSPSPILHLSEAVRLVLLWKHGGMYLDSDVIVVRSFQGLRNSLGLENSQTANAAILVFDRNSEFMRTCMEDYARNFEAKDFENLGSALITRSLKEFCKVSDLAKMVEDPLACRGVTLMTPDTFFPVPLNEWKVLFEEPATVELDISGSRAVHLWGQNSLSKVTHPGSNSVLDHLASSNCPQIYEVMKQNLFI